VFVVASLISVQQALFSDFQDICWFCGPGGCVLALATHRQMLLSGSVLPSWNKGRVKNYIKTSLVSLHSHPFTAVFDALFDA